MKTQSTTPPPPAGRKGLALGAFVVAATLLALAPLEQAQAQLYIDIFPSQDDTNATLWIFSGSTTAARTSTIRTTSGTTWFTQDTARFFDNLFASDPGTGFKSLTAVPASTATNPNKDYKSLIGNLRLRNPAFTNANLNVLTNAPTMTAGANSQTITHLYLRDTSSDDNFGPRVNSALSYTSGGAVSWTGSGTLANVPISTFSTRDPYIRARKMGSAGSFYGGSVGITTQVADGLRIRVHPAIIPEPKEYALIFALFALGFAILRRHWQKRQRQQATTL